MHGWHTGQVTGRFKPGPRTSYEPALAQLEAAKEKALAQGDHQAVAEIDKKWDALLEAMHPGLSTMPPCGNCNQRGHEIQNCPRPTKRGNRRWQRASTEAASGHSVAAAESLPNASQPSTAELHFQRPTPVDVPEFGRAVWLLGSRCVELYLPTGRVCCTDLPCNLKGGSRAVWNSASSNELFVLQNGSSSVLQVRLGEDSAVHELTKGHESSRFRSSLGSRLLLCGADKSKLLVTGTPGNGAHTPWVFDIRTTRWDRLPEASYPILSSAVAANADSVTIVGGWSKAQGCHGHVQVLNLKKPCSWTVSTQQHPVPWRRPGAMCFLAGQLLLALGWMECEGRVGAPGFRLLRRNGAAQRARTSSSKLCTLSLNEAAAEVAQIPAADSFEHSGELHPVGNELVVCVGRDHVQAFSTKHRSWQNWPPPSELRSDGSSSWVKHCGSWALAWIPSSCD
mmetsp:Transcript_74103/g.141027  ORF Transcript_74103/g.141027 Transcript_74103/m.141027 type:complete len:453 (-) Transcript_74103:60-1418(-)